MTLLAISPCDDASPAIVLSGGGRIRSPHSTEALSDEGAFDSARVRWLSHPIEQ
jgi:hypothetical protein